MQLAQALKGFASGQPVNSERVIEILDIVFFDEWEAFFTNIIGSNTLEAFDVLNVIALEHYDSGWRFNALRLLLENSALDDKLIDSILQEENDPDILDMIKNYQL